MDELSKAKKALADAQAIVDKLFVDLGNAVPGTAKYGLVRTAYEKAKDNRDAKKKIYDPLKKASERAAKTEAETATATERNKALLQQTVDSQIPTLERVYKSAEKTYKADPNNPNKATNYLNSMTALNSAYTGFEKQGIVFNRLVIKQNDGNVAPASSAAAAVETAPVVTPGFNSTGGDQPVRAGIGLRVVAPTGVVAEEPPADVPVVKPTKVVITKAEVNAKLAELKLPDTPENRKTARQALKTVAPAGKPAVADNAWETIFKTNYPQYNWMFTDLDRTKYADVFDLFSKSFDKTGKQIIENAEFKRRFEGTSWYTGLEASKKGRELSAAIGNFSWGSGNLAKFLTKAIQFGYEGENLKQQAYSELFNKVDGKYVNDLAIKEVRASSPYLALKRIGTQYLTAFNDQTVEDALAGGMTAEDLLRVARETAKASYPHLKEALDAGVTLEDLSTNYKQIAARTLELDPSQVDMGFKFNEALNYTKDGAPRMLSLSEWETELRTNGKYKYSFTKQANQDATSIGLSIARAFGKVQ